MDPHVWCLKNGIRELRERQTIAQTDLAKRAGISRQALSRIEKGEAEPSVIVALKVSHALKTTVENLYPFFFLKAEKPPSK